MVFCHFVNPNLKENKLKPQNLLIGFPRDYNQESSSDRPPWSSDLTVSPDCVQFGCEFCKLQNRTFTVTTFTVQGRRAVVVYYSVNKYSALQKTLLKY